MRWSCVLAGIAPLLVAAQGLPQSLSGRWTTVDGAASQAMSLTLDSTASKGALSVLSGNPECSIKDAPFTFTSDADKLEITVDAGWSNSCRADVSISLVRQADTGIYVGQLRQGGPAGKRFPVLKVRLSP